MNESFVREACREWGRQRWKLFDPNDGWANVSLLGRIREERDGAGQTYFRQSFKEVYSGLGLEVHRAVQGMPDRPWQILNAHYVFPGRANWKANRLKLHRAEYYRLLNQAHSYIASRLDKPPPFLVCFG